MAKRTLGHDEFEGKAILDALVELAGKIRWPPLRRRWCAVSDLLNREKDDRVLAIVAAAFLEVALEKSLRARLVKRLSGPLGSVIGRSGDLNRKLNLAYCVGLIGHDEFADLVLINKIRNKFAHSHTPMSFRNKAVRECCKQFRLMKKGNTKSLRDARPRDAFRMVVYVLITQLVLMLPDISRIPERCDYTWPGPRPRTLPDLRQHLRSLVSISAVR